MPLFEFVCNDCSRSFEELVRSTSAINDVTCPKCGSSKVNKKISTFASRVSGGGTLSLGGSSAASCSTST